MGTQIFLMVCLGAIGFMVYCLAHFVREGMTPHSRHSARPLARNPRVLRFPESSSAHGRSEEVRRRA